MVGNQLDFVTVVSENTKKLLKNVCKYPNDYYVEIQNTSNEWL